MKRNRERLKRGAPKRLASVARRNSFDVMSKNDVCEKAAGNSISKRIADNTHF